MRRFLEAEIAPVVDGREALVGVLRIVDAVVAGAARHQRRDHHLRADLQRLAHEVFGELRARLDDHAAELMAERERPRQGLGPMAFQDVLIGAAHAAGADLDQRGLLRHRRATARCGSPAARPGPSKVATRIWDLGKGILRLLIPRPEGGGWTERKRAGEWGKSRKFSAERLRPAARAAQSRVAGKDHCPQALNASAKARSPGVPFSIARIARRPLL